MHENETDWQEIGNSSPADLADRMERLPEEAAREVLIRRSPADIAAVISELETEKAADLIREFDGKKLSETLRLLSANQIADLLPFLPVATRETILGQLPADLAARVQALLRYAPDTAGGIMDNRFITVRADETAAEALNKLRDGAKLRSGDVSYIYVVDAEGRLIGVVSLRDLVFSSAEVRVDAIMNPEVRFLQAQDDQEEISRKIQHYPYLGFPVVDENQRLVGVVRIGDAIRVAQSEATEDMQLMVGLSGEERIWTPWKQSIGKRLPWLGVNLGTALGAAAVVSFFEETIAGWTALVAFLPLISAVAGNGGNQALTVIIRSLALGEVKEGDAVRALWKELFIGAANGVALAVAIGLIAFTWKQSAILGVVAGSAMLLNQIIGALAGVTIPFGLRKCRIDPALASSIFVTALTDTLGFLVFLGTAMIAMRFFNV
jgi:magnesium transporter